MKKTAIVLLLGILLATIPLFFLSYSNSVTDTAQCIASFEGQNSLACRTGISMRNGGTLTLANFFRILAVIGAIITLTAVGQLLLQLVHGKPRTHLSKDQQS